MPVALPQVLTSRLAPQLFEHDFPRVTLPQQETGQRPQALGTFVALASAIERMQEGVNAPVAEAGTMVEILLRRKRIGKLTNWNT